MYFALISIFPQMFAAITEYGINKRAIQSGKVVIECINPRDFVCDNYRRIDDRPFGGGAGMVMMAAPLIDAIHYAKAQATQHHAHNCPVVYLSPQGDVLDEQKVLSCLEYDGMILLCGRYDGIDERVMSYVDMEISVGDYVLSGGELPAMILIDSIIRRLGDVIDDQSVANDSFACGLLDYPQYTKPVELNDERVPDVLLSGHHQRIAKWRFFQQLDRTQHKKPKLFADFATKENLPTQKQKWLAEYLAQLKSV